jgi:hypothetical protein
MPNTNQVANTDTTNIVPVQGLFDQNGVCLTLIGPGGEYFWPPIQSVPFGQVQNQPVIETYDRSASIPLTGTPALLKPASTLAGSVGITYEASTGVFTFAQAGSYSLALNVNAIASASGQSVYIYAEKNQGAGWVPNANSGKSYQLPNNQLTQIVYANAVARQAGEQVRYWIYSNDGKVQLETGTLPGVAGVYVPAIRIQYS